MGSLLHSCVEVCEPIKLSFWVVSGVGGGMGVLDKGPGAPGKGRFGGFFCPIGLNRRMAYFLHKNVFDLCVKS